MSSIDILSKIKEVVSKSMVIAEAINVDVLLLNALESKNAINRYDRYIIQNLDVDKGSALLNLFCSKNACTFERFLDCIRDKQAEVYSEILDCNRDNNFIRKYIVENHPEQQDKA